MSVDFSWLSNERGPILEISIIVPNWNGIKFIGMCLDSLARSDFHSYEVIVIDNGSVDGSREMIEEKYPRVRLIKNREMGSYTTL